MPMEQFRGKVILLVNTASFCGFTPQYEGLQKLQTTYGPRGFTVIGVPSGNFLGQEYKSNKEISTFFQTNFGIKFPLDRNLTRLNSSLYFSSLIPSSSFISSFFF